MRAIICPCGLRLEGATAEELFRLARAHIDEHHPSSSGATGRFGSSSRETRTTPRRTA
jgi:hypothetical protein